MEVLIRRLLIVPILFTLSACDVDPRAAIDGAAEYFANADASSSVAEGMERVRAAVDDGDVEALQLATDLTLLSLEARIEAVRSDRIADDGLGRAEAQALDLVASDVRALRTRLYGDPDAMTASVDAREALEKRLGVLVDRVDALDVPR